MESLAFVEIHVSIEDAYDIEIDPIHLVTLNQFGAIVDYIYGCVASRNQRVSCLEGSAISHGQTSQPRRDLGNSEK